jgi:hypothetical protein
MSNAETLAKAAGLDRAWRDHQADVEAAIASVAKLRAGFPRTTDATREPSPAYRAVGPIQPYGPSGPAAIGPKVLGK